MKKSIGKVVAVAIALSCVTMLPIVQSTKAQTQHSQADQLQKLLE